MVAKRPGGWSLTSDEVAVFRMLEDHGPCERGAGTRSYVRNYPSPTEVHQVDNRIALRLAKAGLVACEHGMAELTDEGRAALAQG